MKIAIITEYLHNFGGTEKSILSLINQFKKNKIEFDVYCGIYDPDKTFNEFREIKKEIFIHKKLPMFLNSFYLRYKFSKLELKGYDGYIIFGMHSVASGKNNHPNLWWSTGSLKQAYGEYGKGLYDETILQMSNNNFFKKIILKTYAYFIKKMDQKQINYIDKISCCGKLIKKRLNNTYPKRKIEMIYQPIDIHKYKSSKKGEYYLSVARLTKDKNVINIAKAFTKMPDKKLIIVGKGEEKDNIEEVINNYKNISLKGFVEEDKLIKLYEKSIALIGASEKEDFSMNLMESLSAGKPTISVNTNSKIKCVVNNDTGILIQDNSPDNIINAVRLLTVEEAYRMKNECLKKSRLFSEEVFLNKILNQLQ